MHVLIIYDSTFGNTQKIAEAIAGTLRRLGSVQLVPASEAAALEVVRANLLVVGSPTERRHPTSAMQAILERLPRGGLRGIRLATFDTRCRMARWRSGAAAHSLVRQLRRLGGAPILPAESYFVMACDGPLADGEIERAARWAGTITERMAAPAGRTGFTGKQWVMLVAPLVLVPSMYAAFHGLTALLGHPRGYFLAFLIYWAGWCIALPMAVLGGPRGLLDLFHAGNMRFSRLGWKTQAALWWPIIFPLAFRFIPRVAQTSAAILVTSIGLGLVIGVTEEILWRGVYQRLFPDDIRWNTLYPSAMFALWHAAPLTVVPNRDPGGMASFLVYTVLLGLSYAYYTRKTGSVRWGTVSHCAHDTLGLGGYVYSAWLS